MRRLDRDIRNLAVPALGALVAEPLFLLTDTALVGRLGADPLAGLAIAGTVLQTAVGLLVFLAYATTPTVARRLGGGDLPGAVRAGVDGLWLAAGLGAVLAVAGILSTPLLVRAFGPTAAVAQQADAYLAWAVLGLPGMLVFIAATGLFRGLQDTRTPLLVAVAGFAANAGLNGLLIYGVGLGIAGSAIGTTLAQTGMAVACVLLAARRARRAGVPLRPGLAGVASTALAGGWMLLRTASLRVALVATTVAATRAGTDTLAATQVLLNLYFTAALALDAFAIAGQALVGHALGAADIPRVRAVLRRLLLWGLVWSLVLGAVLAAVAPALGAVFTTDPAIAALITPGVWVLAASLPLGAVVFVLDGILIGAGDGRYLAATGVLNLAAYLPLLWIAVAGGGDAVVGIQLAFCVGFIAARALTLSLRVRGTAWMRSSSTVSP